jgi:hypothetical protein
MAKFAITVEFEVKADSFDEAREKMEAIMSHVKEERLALSSDEVDVVHTSGELDEDGEE